MSSSHVTSILKLVIVTLCSLASLPPGAEGGKKYNVSLAQMATCQEYSLGGSGYMYLDFFHVHNFDNNKAGQGERLHLKFYVLTAMDAHILLSVNNRPRLFDRVYEIVIGAGGNTFSTIRTSMGRRRVATNQDANLLSVFDPTPIEIVQMHDGNLLVYIPGFKEEPLLNFTDASPLNINYISFSTFGSIHARWFYDCQFDGFESEIVQEDRPMSAQQRLIANLTAKGEEKIQPPNLELVRFGFQIRSVAFNQEHSILKTRMHLVLYWNDSSLQWDPKDFDGIESLVQPFLDIWTPRISVLNGALESFGKFKPLYDLMVHSNGSVTMIAHNAELKTFCSNRNPNWPSESVECKVLLGLLDMRASGLGTLQLAYDVTTPLSREPINRLSEWTFVKITVRQFVNETVPVSNVLGLVYSMDGDVSIGFTIVRNSSFYRNVFTMPILACQSLVLLSFLLRGYRRGALLLVVVIVICLGLMFITRHAPSSYVPDIMTAYQCILRIATCCYLLHVAIMWLELFPPKDKPADWVMSIVNCSPLRLVLCMRFSDATEYVAIQEHPWREIAKIINNISFIVINVIFIVVDVVLLPRA